MPFSIYLSTFETIPLDTGSFNKICRKKFEFYDDCRGILNGSKSLATNEANVQSVDVAVVATFTAGCMDMVTSIVADLTPRTRCTVASLEVSSCV